MNDIVYDLPISGVAKVLDKSDRQVRRYVKAERLKARPVRIDGHIKLMFNREQVMAFKKILTREGAFGESGREVVVNGQLIGDKGVGAQQEVDAADVGVQTGAVGPVKYVIDTLAEQIRELQKENRELHYQLEQRSGQVGFLQGRVETLQEELKMLGPAKPSQDEVMKHKPWYRRVFRRG